MKTKTLFFLIFLFSSMGKIFSQQKTLPNSFSLQGEYDKSKLAFYENSILNASMESFRLKETDVVIKFKEGFECVLYSAKSLFIKGIEVDVNHYEVKFDTHYRLPLFSIATDGHLLAEHTVLTKSTTTK